ncbi:MAG: hypothetical protein ACFCBW_04350 [Candidatus Competibacterales bacterium]
MSYHAVEALVFSGEPSFVWLDSVSEEDIVQYLGIKPPTTYHPDVIPLICRYPFQDEENVLFACQRFLKLFIYFDQYLYEYRERTDVLAFIAGFFEAAGFVPAINQLVFQRNWLLKQGMPPQSCEVLSLNHAIEGLYGLRYKNPWGGFALTPQAPAKGTGDLPPSS